jgi:Fur family peroxide stress response transcriptional regulator
MIAASDSQRRLEGIMQTLRSRGQRVTPQRVAIMRNFLARLDHPSAEAIYSDLHAEYPTMAISTVYSTLRVLVELGEAAEMSLATSEARFDPNTSDHCHLVCLNCRTIVDLPLTECARARPMTSTLSERGFTPVRRLHQVFGYCADCGEA